MPFDSWNSEFWVGGCELSSLPPSGTSRPTRRGQLLGLPLFFVPLLEGGKTDGIGRFLVRKSFKTLSYKKSENRTKQCGYGEALGIIRALIRVRRHEFLTPFLPMAANSAGGIASPTGTLSRSSYVGFNRGGAHYAL